jgi:transcriptional regulator with XRE-family HTH domain
MTHKKEKRPLNVLIKENRKAKGLTQTSLAEDAKVSQSLISTLEKGNSGTVTFGTVVALGKILGFCLSDIKVDEESDSVTTEEPHLKAVG